jgi:hypothetical protein
MNFDLNEVLIRQSDSFRVVNVLASYLGGGQCECRTG